jgi:hypothetical protein
MPKAPFDCRHGLPKQRACFPQTIQIPSRRASFAALVVLQNRTFILFGEDAIAALGSSRRSRSYWADLQLWVIGWLLLNILGLRARTWERND